MKIDASRSGRMSDRKLRIGTRTSALARWQADWVLARLGELFPGIDAVLVPFSTSGDRILDKPLPEIGGKGLFTAELERALVEGEIDVAVHSLKDLPVDGPAKITLGAICERGDFRDAFVSARYASVDALPMGARVGTSSLRRSSQLLALRADLRIVSLRGNVDTRLRKATEGDYDAIVLAATGAQRLGRSASITAYFPAEDILPAPGQAALAVQCREDDETTLSLLAAIDHGPTRQAVTAERSFLKALGGGCAAPIAALCLPEEGLLRLRGLVAALDGSRLLRVAGSGPEAEELGERLAREALAQGAGELLR